MIGVAVVDIVVNVAAALGVTVGPGPPIVPVPENRESCS